MPAKKVKKVQTPVKKKTVSKKPTAKKTVSAAKTMAKKVEKKDQLIKKEIAIPKEVKTKKILWPIIILLIALALWFLKDQVIVAMVNGKPITRFQVIKELEKQGASQVLDSLVTMELVKQVIDKSAIEIDEEAIKQQMTEIEENLSAQGQNLDDILVAQNLTRADVEKDIKLNLQLDKILADKIQVSEEEVLEYFETNKEFLGEDANFEEMKADIEAQVIQEKRATAQQEWLETIRGEANIRYLRFEPSLF